MIARTWVGRVPRRHADGFEGHLKATGVAESARTAGNRGARVERTERDDHAVFRLVTYWDSWEAVRRFAGEDVAKAVLYPGDEAYELVPALRVEHEEIATVPAGGPDPEAGPMTQVRASCLAAARVAAELVADPAVTKAWQAPSALPRMSVGALASHLAGRSTSWPGCWRDRPPPSRRSRSWTTTLGQAGSARAWTTPSTCGSSTVRSRPRRQGPGR